MKYLLEITKDDFVTYLQLLVKLTFHISKEHVYLFCQPYSMTTRLHSAVAWQGLTRCSPNPLPLL